MSSWDSHAPATGLPKHWAGVAALRRLSVLHLAGAHALRCSGQAREEDLWIVSTVTSGFQFRQLV